MILHSDSLETLLCEGFTKFLRDLCLDIRHFFTLNGLMAPKVTP